MLVLFPLRDRVKVVVTLKVYPRHNTTPEWKGPESCSLSYRASLPGPHNATPLIMRFWAHLLW